MKMFDNPYDAQGFLFSICEYRFSTSERARLAYAITVYSFESLSDYVKIAEMPTGLASTVTNGSLFTSK